MKINCYESILPSATRGALFEKTAPLDPPQKLFIKGGHSLQSESIFMQTMTAFGLLKVRRLKRRSKASIPLLHANSNESFNIRYFDTFVAVSIHLKKTSGGPNGLIGPPCHGDKEII